MVFHEIETNGIGYIDIMFDMSEVPEELLPYGGNPAGGSRNH